jgi:hypothetical protein
LELAYIPKSFKKFRNFITYVFQLNLSFFKVFPDLLSGVYDKYFITNILWQMFYDKHFMAKEQTLYFHLNNSHILKSLGISQMLNPKKNYYYFYEEVYLM